MRSRDKDPVAPRLAVLACLAAALAASGCATNTAPPGWLDEPDEFLSSAYGGWIEIRYTHVSGGPPDAAGELIALDADSVYFADERLVSLPRSMIESATLVAYHASTEGIAGLTVLGALSSASTGFFVVFGVPVWILGGVAAGRARSQDPLLLFPEVSLDAFAPFARFPYGLPACVDRSAIWRKRVRAPGEGDL